MIHPAPETITALAFKCREAYDKGTLPQSARYTAAGGVEFRIWEGTSHRDIAFAGTNEMADVAVDLTGIGRCMLSEDLSHGGSFHTGFLKAFQRAYPKICSELYLRAQLYGPKPLRICGHSLGGAYAVQLSEASAFKDDVAMVVTYGCPRLCNIIWALASTNTRKITRVVLDADMVPRLLIWRWWILHLGLLWFIDGRNTLHKSPPWWRRLASFVIERPSGHISDHSIDSYCVALSAGNQATPTETRIP